MINIAAEVNGNIWHPNEEVDYVLDLNDDSVHLHVGGLARCWRNLTRQDRNTKRRTCIMIEDPGDSHICELCIRSFSKKTSVSPY